VFVDSVITSIRALDAASAEAADSPQLQHALRILADQVAYVFGLASRPRRKLTATLSAPSFSFDAECNCT
jgi:hypothetical protein